MNDQKKQNELAIFSLLVAVSSIFCAPLVLPAIFMGYVARRRIKKYPDLYGGKAFTTATIILSYAVLVAVAILSFWVYPALRKKMGLVPALSQSETASQVGAGQKSQNVDGSCISLKAYINASFTSSISSPKGIKVNTLEALPQGKHLYGGVPFETEGIVQLMGRSLLRWGKKYPNKVPDILIGKNCKRLYLLHGASWVKTPGQEIAKLTLNYTDGTKQDISIVSGKHILDWWGAPQEQEGMAQGSRLAWIGTNPYITKMSPGASLRLYESAFDNPRPNQEIASVDYESLLTDAAPFLIGLTVE